jgi:CheY-like chemotaxis protein
VLVVDDDAAVLRTLAQLIAADGYDITTATGGQAGVDALVQAHAKDERFDVVLTDLGMPEVDGREVARTAKRLAPECRVVVLSGSGEAALEDPAGWSDRMLTKPPRRADLRAAIEGREPRDEN